MLGPPRAGRVLAICGDSADSHALQEAAPECDLLVHECTFSAEAQDKARRTRHSTTRDVIALARRVRPRILVLSHWSPRYDGRPGALSTEDLRREVAEALPGVRVVAGHDLLELDVPEREPNP